MRRVTDEAMLEALLTHGGASGAAAALKISRTAVYNRLRDNDFRKQYDTLQRVILSSAVSVMCAAVTDAVTCLEKIVNRPDENVNARITAADSILRHCVRYVELTTIENRLDEIENAISGMDK